MIKIKPICIFALAILITTVLRAELVNPNDSPGINPKDLLSSDLVCIGEFVKNSDNSFCNTVKGILTKDGQTFQGEWCTGEFKIKDILKGGKSSSARVSVFVVDHRSSFAPYGAMNPLPWSEKMLLLLRKDNESPGRYLLVNQANSWILLPKTAAEDSSSSSSKSLDDLIKEQLLSICQTPLDLNFSTTEMDRAAALFPDRQQALDQLKLFRLNMIEQAAATIAKCRYGDDSLMSILKRFSQFGAS